MRRLLMTMLGAALCVAAVRATAAQECEPSKVAEKYPAYADKTVKVAVSPNVPPFTYADPKDLRRMTGLEVEVMEQVLGCAGLNLELVLGSWNGNLAGLFAGVTDVMIGNVNYTADRARRATYVIFMRNGESVVVQKGNPRGIHDINDLCGTTSAMGMASLARRETELLSKACVDQGKRPISIQLADGQEPAYQLLWNARVDFVMDSAPSVAARLAASSDEYDSAFTFTTENVSGPLVAKGNKLMMQVLFDGLKVMERSGELKKLMAKYGLPEQLLVPVEVRN